MSSNVCPIKSTLACYYSHNRRLTAYIQTQQTVQSSPGIKWCCKKTVASPSSWSIKFCSAAVDYQSSRFALQSAPLWSCCRSCSRYFIFIRVHYTGPLAWPAWWWWWWLTLTMGGLEKWLAAGRMLSVKKSVWNLISFANRSQLWHLLDRYTLLSLLSPHQVTLSYTGLTTRIS